MTLASFDSSKCQIHQMSNKQLFFYYCVNKLIISDSSFWMFYAFCGIQIKNLKL